MPVDAFIIFKPAEGASMMDIPGESQDDYFLKNPIGKNTWFEISSFTLNIENVTTVGSATGGAGSGKVKFNEFEIKKTIDACSPAFFKNCCAGAHYELVRIACRKAGGGGQNATGAPYLLFNFSTVFTTKVDWSGPGDEAPEETINFAYGALMLQYAQQGKDGKLMTPKEVSWDQVKNKSTFVPKPPDLTVS